MEILQGLGAILSYFTNNFISKCCKSLCVIYSYSLYVSLPTFAETIAITIAIIALIATIPIQSTFSYFFYLFEH